jgi:hypothetical protein
MKEQQFWDWFLTNKVELEQFISSGSDDYYLYHKMISELKNYNENVVAELTMNVSNKYVLIITCDGKRDGIGYVETLYDKAPAIENWVIQKFRSPGHVRELNYQGLTVKPSDIKIRYAISEHYYDLELFIKGYTESDQRYMSLAFLYLDHLVGEYNVMTRIGTIDFKKLSLFTKTSGMITLEELRVVIEKLN